MFIQCQCGRAHARMAKMTRLKDRRCLDTNLSIAEVAAEWRQAGNGDALMSIHPEMLFESAPSHGMRLANMLASVNPVHDALESDSFSASVGSTPQTAEQWRPWLHHASVNCEYICFAAGQRRPMTESQVRYKSQPPQKSTYQVLPSI